MGICKEYQWSLWGAIDLEWILETIQEEVPIKDILWKHGKIVLWAQDGLYDWWGEH